MDIRSQYLRLARERAIETQEQQYGGMYGSAKGRYGTRRTEAEKQAIQGMQQLKSGQQPEGPRPSIQESPESVAAKTLVKMKKGRGRPKGSKNKPKQSQKDKEDEKLAMEVKGLEDKVEGGKKKKMSKAQQKKAAMELGAMYAKEIGQADDEVRELHGAGFWGDFAKGFKQGFDMVVKPVAHVAKAIAPEVLPGVAGKAVKAGLEAVGYGKGKEEEEEGMKMEVEEKKGGKKPRRKRQASAAMKKRGAVVSKLMKEKGMSLGEASKHIKAHPELLK